MNRFEELKERLLKIHRCIDIGFGPDCKGCSSCHVDLGETTWGPDLLQPGDSLWPCETILAVQAVAEMRAVHISEFIDGDYSIKHYCRCGIDGNHRCVYGCEHEQVKS
jgi:hypothetical protein